MAGTLILFESWRTRRNAQNRRQGVATSIEDLQEKVERIGEALQNQINLLESHQQELEAKESQIAMALERIAGLSSLNVFKPDKL